MTPPDLRGQIVLVVDDSPASLSFLNDALEAAGLTVLVAIDAESALALLDRVTPDVILMDAVMPGMDGFEACRRIKLKPHLAHAPILFMTGLSDPEHVVQGFEAGGVDYVTKPTNPDVLIARVRAHLSTSRGAHAAQSALDASGRHLFAASRDGRIAWGTPEALRLLRGSGEASSAPALPAGLLAWLSGSDASVHSSWGEPGASLRFTLIGATAAADWLLRVNMAEDEADRRLRQKLPLTAREAEVLTWIARGKANRDIAQILGLSPRTVNKHLEQIFAKLGVENRTAAAAVAMRILDGL